MIFISEFEYFLSKSIYDFLSMPEFCLVQVKVSTWVIVISLVVLVIGCISCFFGFGFIYYAREHPTIRSYSPLFLSLLLAGVLLAFAAVLIEILGAFDPIKYPGS